MSKPSHLEKNGLNIALRWLRLTTTAMGQVRSNRGKAIDAIFRPYERSSLAYFEHHQPVRTLTSIK